LPGPQNRPCRSRHTLMQPAEMSSAGIVSSGKC
jgi:hypothetical protein